MSTGTGAAEGWAYGSSYVSNETIVNKTGLIILI
jgi:hypothetical protein